MKNFTLLLSLIVGISAHAQVQKNLGADLSLLQKYEDYSTPYYTTTGSKISNVLTYLRDNVQMNSVRVRLFVNPTNAKKDGTFQDLDYVTKFGKRIKDAGMQFLLDIHYSDNWADPSNQSVPSSWYTGTLSASNPSNAVLTDKMYSYTKEVLTHLNENGATPDFIQIGNEISYGMLWRTNNDRCLTNSTVSVWKRFTDLLSSAAKAVREVTPEAKIILHIERSGDKDTAVKFFNTMKNNKVDYDIIGLSYYPFWHKSLATLSTTLSALENNFPEKEIQIVETAYYYQYFPTEQSYENTTSTWQATSAGQKAYVEDLIKTLNEHSHVTGLYYWCPEENGCGGTSWNANRIVITDWINRGLWDNNTHKALPALFSLKQFNGENTVGIDGIVNDNFNFNDNLNPNFNPNLNPNDNLNDNLNDNIYSVQGSRLSNPPSRGIYIKGGKKYIQ